MLTWTINGRVTEGYREREMVIGMWKATNEYRVIVYSYRLSTTVHANFHSAFTDGELSSIPNTIA